jgi:tRNA modification GTPase
MNADDTIAAIASAPGGACRGLVRISGPAVVACLSGCFRCSRGQDLAGLAHPTVVPGRIALGDPLGDVPADLYLWPGPRSYTRQPLAELHTVGAPPVLHATLATVCAAGARLAGPGEFTLRAFLAGRLDLTQAEAVLAVIDAGSRIELDIALRQLAGGLAGPLHQLRNQLLDLLARVEAGLDFVDEDIEFIADDDLHQQLEDVAQGLARLAAQLATRNRADEPFRVVLTGWPNVGKSSLMNALAGTQAALVSPHAGTTRDYLTRTVDIAGLDCRLVDTAGWDTAASEPVARSAKTLAAQQTGQAHVQLFCLDATRPLNAWERDTLETPANRILVLTKTDLPHATDLRCQAIATSSHTGAGLEALQRAIYQSLTADRNDSEVVAGTAIRCGDSLRRAAAAVRLAQQAVPGGEPDAGKLANARKLADDQQVGGDELVAAELRLALDELAQVVGAVYTEDILDRIFSRFCIGK